MLLIPNAAPGVEDSTPSVAPGDPAANAVQSSLQTGLRWLKTHESKAADGDVEGIHQLRVTTRRLRSALGTFHTLIDPAWAGHVSAELKWLGGELGAVRDLDVLRHRLATAAEETDTAAALAPLFAELDRKHAEASETLREALRGDRFGALTDEIAQGLVALPFTDDAYQECRDVLPSLVDETWKALKRGGRALSPDDPEDHFHAVRKHAKRARYAAEAVKEALDHKSSTDAAQFAKKARKVQEILGLHQDAVVAGVVIQQAALARPDLGPFNFAAGRLLERESREAADSRTRFFEVWPALDRKKTVRWLRV